MKNIQPGMNTPTPEYIVGIGASAGGLEAIERFFEKMQPETDMAFVVVQHLSPDFKSLMSELLARKTPMRILQAEHDMPIHGNTIYLIPPKKELVLSNHRIQLADKGSAGELNMPIDHFFHSLANDVGSRGVAIVLSGTGSDGSRGIESVHRAGGMVLVQSPETAKFDGMPQSSIATSCADLVASPEEIALYLQTRQAESPLGISTSVWSRNLTACNRSSDS